jgi:hypothetical protein
MNTGFVHPIGNPALSHNGARGLTAVILDRPEQFASLEHDWRKLAAEVRPRVSMFALPSVHAALAAGTAGHVAHKIVAVYRQRRLAAVLPMMIDKVWRGPRLGVRYDFAAADRKFLQAKGFKPVPVRQLSPLLSLAATTPGPCLVCHPAELGDVTSAIAGAIAGLPGWDVAVWPAFEGPQVECWSAALSHYAMAPRVQRIGRECMYLSSVAHLSTLIDSQNKKFRQNFRRATHAAERLNLRLETCFDLPRVLDTVAFVAAASWKERGRAGQDVLVPYSGDQQCFFERLIGAPGPDIQPFMVAARIADRPVAVMLAAAHGETLTTLLTFWSGEARDASPGLLVLGGVLDWAADNNIRLIDFNTNNPWIRHFVDRVDVLQNVLAFAPTLRGRVLSTMASLFARAEPA